MSIYSNYVPTDLSEVIIKIFRWKIRIVLYFTLGETDKMRLVGWSEIQNWEKWFVRSETTLPCTKNLFFKVICKDIINKSGQCIMYTSGFVNSWKKMKALSGH